MHSARETENTQGTQDNSDWMTKPNGVTNCPRGLEYLTSINQLLVRQKVEIVEEDCSDCETINEYFIKNSLGETVYYAIEDPDYYTSQCYDEIRPFDMIIFDQFRNEVMHLRRPLACSLCGFPCRRQSMKISAPPGDVIGTVEEKRTFCYPAFRLKNHAGDTVLRIVKTLRTSSMDDNVSFDIISLTGRNIGRISKQGSGCCRGVFTDIDFVGINFPLDLDVRMKAVLLGALFLIDYLFTSY